MNTDAVFWTVVNSVKELEAENEKLRSEKSEMNARIERLEKMMDASD